jgi:hypothetical protein
MDNFHYFCKFGKEPKTEGAVAGTGYFDKQRKKINK